MRHCGSYRCNSLRTAGRAGPRKEARSVSARQRLAIPSRPTAISPDASVRNGIQGDAEITVQGRWTLQITVTGPAGTSQATVPLIATTVAPAIPGWFAWLIGSVPLYALLVFLLVSRRRKAVHATVQM